MGKKTRAKFTVELTLPEHVTIFLFRKFVEDAITYYPSPDFHKQVIEPIDVRCISVVDEPVVP